MPREVILVDANLGNLDSVEHALIQVGASVHISSDPDRVATARTVVFPGQGSFGPSTNAIIQGAMGDALRMVIYAIGFRFMEERVLFDDGPLAADFDRYVDFVVETAELRIRQLRTSSSAA